MAPGDERRQTWNAEPAEVLLLGHPGLRARSATVHDLAAREFRRGVKTLHATLAAFRRRHGFGRAIAAPQIGVRQRFLAADLGNGPFTLINPRIVERSAESFTLWDDCMSFPELLVRVRRRRSISITFVDDAGREQTWRDLETAESELFQHELDHLDGVLAVDRALDREAVVHRQVFEADPETFRAQVD